MAIFFLEITDFVRTKQCFFLFLYVSSCVRFYIVISLALIENEIGMIVLRICRKILILSTKPHSMIRESKTECDNADLNVSRSISDFLIVFVSGTAYFRELYADFALVEHNDDPLKIRAYQSFCRIETKRNMECEVEQPNAASSVNAQCKEIQLKLKIKVNSRKKVENKKAIGYNCWYAVYNENNVLIKHFYSCIICDEVTRVDVHNNGTNQLNRHKCVKSNNQSKLLSFFKKKPKNDFGKELTKASCQFVVKDMRPAIAVEGNGLADLLSLATKIGAVNGFMEPDDIKKLMPDPTTVCIRFFFQFTVFYVLQIE